MIIFSLRKEDGAYYPMILLKGSQEVMFDDACGGYEMRTDAIAEVRRCYGEDAECVSQRTLHDEFLQRVNREWG